MSTTTTVAERVQRIVFAAGSGVLLLGFAIGVVASVRSGRSVPAPNLLVEGPAVLVRRLLIAKDWGGAVRQLRAYGQLSNDRLPHEQLAEALFGLGPEARAGFAEALRDGGPGYAQGHYQLGLAHERAEEHDRAAAELEEALKLRPRFPEARNALGVTLINEGRPGEASAHFREAGSQGYAPALENLERLEALLRSQTP